ncbi:unnamed protein product [[Candida] boidinii]|uniref:Unnamed protein product n=1 Tax=Candida boidinii TaxID=5477 RepID=A0A9W6T0V3_CANBO|nr:unnamed protein product [[Candida] boidinii]
MSVLEEIKEKESKRERDLKEQEEEQEELLEDYKKNKNDYEWVNVDELEKEKINPDLVSEQKKIKLTADELFKYDSGVLGVNIIGGKLIRPNCYIHILLDDASWPSFVSSEVIQKNVTTDSGECFVRDLKNSTMIVRLVRKQILESKNDVMEEKSFKVSEILKKGHDEPVTLDLNGNRIKVLFDYIPNSSHLSPSESMNDTGIMELNLKSGSGLMSADRNGKSDPFALLFLNGVEIFKSSVAKKTLDPVWNEKIKFPIRSVSRGEVKLVVYDWDRAVSNDLLGEAILDLSRVKPNGAVQMNVPLDTQGSIQVEVKFQPQYIRPGADDAFSMSDTLNLVSKAPLKLVSDAADIGGAVGGTVGGVALNTLGTGTSGAANVASSLAKGLRFGSKKKSMENTRENGSSSSSKETSHHHGLLHRESFQSELRPPSGNHSSDVQSSRTGGGISVPPSPIANKRQSQHSARTSMDVSSFMSSSMDGNTIPGRVKVEYLEGVDKKVGLNCKVVLVSPNKNKEIYKSRSVKPSSGTVKWNESTAFKAPAIATMQFVVKEHRTFGKSNEFAEGSILLADIAGKSDDVPITLSNGSILYVNFNYHTQILRAFLTQKLYPAEIIPAPKKNRKTAQPQKLRKSLVPGTVLILLAGRFRGKRVVYLKHLEDNTLLVSGPFKVNGVPLRRVNARYVIATSTTVSVEGLDLAKFDVAYFAREKASKDKKSEEEFFGEGAAKKQVKSERVEDQKVIDKALIGEIKKTPLLKQYLASSFSLKNGDKPHSMVF